MTEPTRLFDCIEYHLERSPIPDMLAAKENGQWKKYSTGEVSEIVNGLSSGLINLGYGCGDKTEQGRDKIAVLSKNRPEWIMLDLAVQQIGAILTPVHEWYAPGIGCATLASRRRSRYTRCSHSSGSRVSARRPSPAR